MAMHSAASPSYCPYDVVALRRTIDGEELVVESAFGPLACLRAGPADGVGTVFLHGVHDDMSTWTPVVRAAMDRGSDLGRALFVDLPGFGRSANRLGRLDLDVVGDAVLDAARQLIGEAPVRLVGHSMGTLVAADLAMRRPDRIRSLHLSAGPFYSIVDTMNGRLTSGLDGLVAGALFGSQYLLALTGPAGVSGLRALARIRGLRPLLAPFVAHPFAVRASVVDHVLDGMRPAGFRAAAPSGFRYSDGMSWAGIACPVHAAFGATDRLVPRRDARRLTTDVPHALVTVIAEAGHLVHLEQPVATLDALGLS
jgi:pimeloyl-ACP methyl ester carboxylesterase